MSKLSRVPAAGLLLGLLCVSLPAHAISCLIFPLSCLSTHKKYGEETEATVLDIRTVRTENYEMQVGPGAQPGIYSGWSSLENKRDWYVWFRIGHTLYQGWHQDTNVFSMAFAYKPKREEWIGKTMKLRFMDQNFLGVKGSAAMFKRSDGKEWQLNLVSIIGPDGVDECAHHGLILCPPQAKIDRGKVEAEKLAAVQKAGKQSAAEVAAAPVEISETQADPAAAPAPEAAAGAPAANAATDGSPGTIPPAPPTGGSETPTDGAVAPEPAQPPVVDAAVPSPVNPH